MPVLQPGNRARPQVTTQTGQAPVPTNLGARRQAAGEQLGQAIGQYGFGREDIEQKIFNVEANNQFAEGQIKYKERISEMESKFDARNDYSNFGEEWDKNQTDIVSEMARDITNPEASRQFNLYARGQAVAGGGAFRRGAGIRLADRASKNIPIFMEGSAIEASRITGVDARAEFRKTLEIKLAKDVENRLLAPKEDEILLQQYNLDLAALDKDNGKKAFQNTLEEMARVDGLDAAVKKASEPGFEDQFGLDREETQPLINIFKGDVETRTKLAKKENDEMQYQTLKTAMVSIANGKITDPKHITTLLDVNAITVTQAESLRSAMVPPDVSDKATLSSINDTMLEYALGDITKKQALDAIIKASPKLKDTATDTLINDLTAGASQTTAKAVSDSNKSMERIIGSATDLLGNIVIGSDFEEFALIDAKLFLEQEVRDAIIAKKPMTSADIRIRSVELAYEAKLRLPEDTQDLTPKLEFEKRKTYKDAYEGMTDASKELADGMIAEGKTEQEILELFNAR